MNSQTNHNLASAAGHDGKGENITGEHLSQELKDSVSQVGSAFRRATHAVSEDLGTAAKDTYNSLMVSGKEGVRDIAHQVEGRVKESPFLAIGVAFGVGLLASWLFSRDV